MKMVRAIRALVALAVFAEAASAATVTQSVVFEASDGTMIHAFVGGEGALSLLDR